MKFLHLSDLHLGRSLCVFSLLDVQRDFLMQVLSYIDENRVDAVVLSGDVYDRTMPPLGAVQLLNEFLTQLCCREVPALIISGNHDSPERLCFLSDLLTRSRVYLCGEYTLGQQPITLRDRLGPVHFHLLPFFRPGVIRAQAPEESIAGLDDAVRVAVEHMPINREERNVLLMHQFVSSAAQETLRSDSEMLCIGGTEPVNAAHLDAFDYVALGHLHRCQQVGRPQVRYAGAPLKYALSEAGDEKYFLCVTLGEKGDTRVEKVPVRPSLDLRALRGTLSEVLTMPVERPDDFFTITLTDPEPVYDAMQKLRTRFPHVVNVQMERDRFEGTDLLSMPSAPDLRDPMRLFEQFYEETAGCPMTDLEREDIRSALAQAEEEAIQ